MLGIQTCLKWKFVEKGKIECWQTAKDVSGDSGSRYKYGEKFPFRCIIMAPDDSIGVLLFLLLLPSNVQTAQHDCSTEHTKYYLESKLGRDISYVRHDVSGSCSVQFADDSG